MSADLGALLLADARLPTGGHAHSSGLEPAIAAGVSVAQVPGYIDARLRSVGLVESCAAVFALRAAGGRPERLHDVQDALAARSPSAPLRAASGLLGRGLTRLAVRLWPRHPAVAVLADFGVAPLRPVALGAVAAAIGLEEAAVARIVLYDDVQCVAAAALKLLAVDPTEVTGWVLNASDTVERVVSRAVGIRDLARLPAVTAPLVEQWSLDHRDRTRRIFVA